MTRGTNEPITAEDVADATERLLGELGFEGLSVRRIAEVVGVSRQVVYTHFGGMDGLFDALHVRFVERLTEAVGSADGPRGTTEHLVRASREYRTVARRSPSLYQLAFERPIADRETGAVAVREGLISFGVIVDAAGAWLAEHGARLPPFDPASPGEWPRPAVRLARSLWSVLHGFVVLERVGFGEPEEVDPLIDDTVRALLDGWRVDGTP